MTTTNPTDQSSQPLENQVEEMAFLQRLDRELNWVLDISYVVDITMDWAIRRTAATTGLIALRKGDYLEVRRVIGAGPSNVERLTREPWPIASGAISQVIKDEAALYVPQTSQENGYMPIILDRSKSMISQPMMVGRKVIGVMHLESEMPDYFTEDMRAFLDEIASRAALALKNAEAYTRTQDAEQLKSDIIRLLAHDLRNPLNTIRSAVNLANRFQDEIPDLVKTGIEMIDHAGNEMNMLIEELLTMEKLEANVQLDERPIDLVVTMKEALDRLQTSIERKQQKLVINAPSRAIYARGEHALFRQAIMNLISNAVKYTPPEGRIVLRLERLGSKVFFDVKDNGYGIPEDKQHFLFTKFYRAHAESRIQGTGLGLNLVKAIVERASGEVWFESKPEVGSTFGFWLPAADAKGNVAESEASTAQTLEPTLFDERLQRRRLRQRGQSWQ